MSAWNKQNCIILKNLVYQVTIFRTFLIQAINTQLENNPLEFKNHQW